METPRAERNVGRKSLAFAEGPADSRAVLRHPVTSELEEVVHIVSIHLRPDKQVMGRVKANTRGHVYLEVIITFQEGVRAAATGELIAVRLRIVELQVDRADTKLQLRNHAFEFAPGRHPDAVEIVKSGPVVQAGVARLSKAEIAFGADAKVRRNHIVRAYLSEGAAHARGAI